MDKTRIIQRELEFAFREAIKDAKKQRASAWRTQRWSELATSEAYLNGLDVGLELVKIIMGRHT